MGVLELFLFKRKQVTGTAQSHCGSCRIMWAVPVTFATRYLGTTLLVKTWLP